MIKLCLLNLKSITEVLHNLDHKIILTVAIKLVNDAQVKILYS